MSENANLPVQSKGLSFMPRHRPSETNDRVEGTATVTLHPFHPMVFNICSLSAATTRADRAPAGHESYCSAPPLILPPRPSRDQEARRPREPIWLGKREAPESEAETVFAISHADAIDAKPDVAMLAAASCNARPAAPAKTSPPAAQQILFPSVRMRMGEMNLRPTPPPL